jgi:hypothetical protein
MLYGYGGVNNDYMVTVDGLILMVMVILIDTDHVMVILIHIIHVIGQWLWWG